MTGAGPQVRTVQVRDGTRIHTLVWEPAAPGGPAEPPPAPFLLVHGLASNAWLWSGVGERLAARGHQVVAVDQRSHGSSQPSDHLDLVTLTDDLVDVAGALDLDHPVVVGQSWGGNVVVELAARRPDALRAVVAIDGGTIELADAFGDLETCWAQLTPPDWDALAVPYGDLVASAAQRHPDWPEAGWRAQLGNLAVRPDGTATAILTLARHRRIVEDLYEHRPSLRLPTIPVPVLLLPVAGDGSDADDWAARQRAAVEAALATAPRARARWFEGRSHDVHAEAPDEVVAAIVDHLPFLLGDDA